MTRRTNTIAFDTLEPRRLQAVDLVVTAVNLEASATSTDGYVNYSVTVKNIGDTQMFGAMAVVKTNLSKDAKFANSGDDAVWDYGYVSKDLQPGEQQTITMSWTETAGNKAGFYQIVAMVDPDNHKTESNNDNNVGVSSKLTYYDPIPVTKPGGFDGTLSGTSGNDKIGLYKENDRAIVVVNDQVWGRRLTGIKTIFLDGGTGNDRIAASEDFPLPMRITGAGGNDTIIGGAMNDELSGANGSDRIYGALGNDLLVGGAQGDRLYGEAGNDTCNGHGGNDWMYGGDGANQMFGAAGNDRFFAAGNGASDVCGGGAGSDAASADANDVLGSIETQ